MEEENRDTTDFGKMCYHCLDFTCDLSLNVPQDITKKNKALKDIPEFVGASECTQLNSLMQSKNEAKTKASM